MPDPIKVLIVEDSPTVSRIISALVESDPALQLVGVATDGAEAIRLTSRLRPNIITMDVNMPRMSGLEATEYIMAHQPTPILVVTAFSKQDLELSFKMLSAGALEILDKPSADEWKMRREYILDRIKLLSRIKVITHVRGKSRLLKEIVPPEEPPARPSPPEQSKRVSPRDAQKTAPLDPKQIYRPQGSGSTPPARAMRPSEAIPASPPPEPGKDLLSRRFDVLGVAASTGGPPALARLLREMPATFPVPIFVVQHIPAGFSTGLADWLNGETPLKVKLASEGEKPLPGFVYLPADDRHLAFLPDGRMRLDSSEARYGLRPSADITFESMSKVWPGTTYSVILTGMGRDGSHGMRQLRLAGGYNIAQDEASCVIFGMPKAAIDLGVVDLVLPLGHIAPFTRRVFKVPA